VASFGAAVVGRTDSKENTCRSAGQAWRFTTPQPPRSGFVPPTQPRLAGLGPLRASSFSRAIVRCAIKVSRNDSASFFLGSARPSRAPEPHRARGHVDPRARTAQPQLLGSPAVAQVTGATSSLVRFRFFPSASLPIAPYSVPR